MILNSDLFHISSVVFTTIDGSRRAALPLSCILYINQRTRKAWRPGNEAWRPGNEAWRPGNEAWRPGNEAWRPGNEAWRLGNEAT